MIKFSARKCLSKQTYMQHIKVFIIKSDKEFINMYSFHLTKLKIVSVDKFNKHLKSSLTYAIFLASLRKWPGRQHTCLLLFRARAI